MINKETEPSIGLPNTNSVGSKKSVGTSSKPKILMDVNLRFTAYDFKLLDFHTKKFSKWLQSKNVDCSAPRPVPTNKMKFAVRRAPNIYKCSFEKFEFRSHARIMWIRKCDLALLASYQFPSVIKMKILTPGVSEAMKLKVRLSKLAAIKSTTK